MPINWEINIGSILVIITMMGAAAGFVFRTGTFTETIKAMKDDIQELKESNREVSKALTSIAVQSNRQDNLERQMILIAAQVEDLRHGRGFIQEGRMSIDDR